MLIFIVKTHFNEPGTAAQYTFLITGWQTIGIIVYRTTTSVGAFTARWIPVVGYALLAYDFTKEIALPMAEGMSEYQESNRRSGNWIANLPH